MSTLVDISIERVKDFSERQYFDCLQCTVYSAADERPNSAKSVSLNNNQLAAVDWLMRGLQRLQGCVTVTDCAASMCSALQTAATLLK